VLLDSTGRADLLAAAEPLPHVLCRQALGLELRLDGACGADLAVAAVPAGPDGHLLLQSLLDGDIPGGPAAGRLAHALSEWRQGIGWWRGSCRFLLLEVDAAAGGSSADSPPSVHLAPRGANNSGSSRDCSENAFHRDPAGLVGALAELAGREPDTLVVAELQRVLALLPEGSELFSAAAMLSRPTVAAPRIAVRRVPARDVSRLLKELDRPVAAEALAPLAVELEPLITDLCLGFDLGPEGSDAVGLELHAGSYWSRGERSGWSPLLDALVGLGLADGDRAEAAARLPRPGGERGAAIGLSHAKLTAVGVELAATKIYVGCDGAHRL
jgi:hypothetical protein